MPIYAFACPECGPFDVSRPMADAAAPASCDTCGAPASRVFTPPRLAALARPVRGLLDREERSGHEPDVVTQKGGTPMHHHHHGGSAPMPWVMSH